MAWGGAPELLPVLALPAPPPHIPNDLAQATQSAAVQMTAPSADRADQYPQDDWMLADSRRLHPAASTLSDLSTRARPPNTNLTHWPASKNLRQSTNSLRLRQWQLLDSTEKRYALPTLKGHVKRNLA